MDNYPGAACIGWDDNSTCLLTLRNKDGKEATVFLQDEYQYNSGKEADKRLWLVFVISIGYVKNEAFHAGGEYLL